MTKTANAFWIIGAGQGEIRGETLKIPGTGEVGVRTLFSAVSKGTESLVLRGHVPLGEASAMRAPFQAGEFPWPVKYGYIAVGVVEDGPADLRGQIVFCLHPHQDYFVVPASAVVGLPHALPPERAVLAANMETAVNAMWDGAPKAGERIAVIGAGVVGCLVAALAAKVPGTRVQLIDVAPAKAAIARALGLGFCLPEDADGDVDLVVHASGNPAGLERALSLAGIEGRILELSWYGTTRVSLSLGAAFHAKRLRIISSQVGRIGAAMSPRWTHSARLALALDLLCDPVFDSLISGEDPFPLLPQLLPRLSTDPSVLCHRITYRN